jgi:hypothetical protein
MPEPTAFAACFHSPSRRLMKLSVATAILAGVMAGASSLRADGADDMAYLVTKNGTFGTIDLATGAFSTRGTTGGVTLAGLGVANGNLYGVSYGVSSGSLYEVNPANGGVTTVGVAGPVNYYDIGSTTSGLYALADDTNLDLYSINPTDGVATLVGPTHLSLGSITGLSDNSSSLYLTTGTNLYTLNTTTGTPTLVGGLGGSQQIGALLQEGGILYGSQEIPSAQVDTVNPTTGTATAGPTIAGTSDIVYGLAIDPLPEPSTWAGMILGAGALAILAKKRSKAQS